MYKSKFKRGARKSYGSRVIRKKSGVIVIVPNVVKRKRKSKKRWY